MRGGWRAAAPSTSRGLLGDELHLAAYTPVSPSADSMLKNAFPVHIGEVRTITEAVRKKTSYFVSDFETDPNVSARSRELMRARGFRSTLYVPILHNDVVHGLMHVSKVEPGPFSPQWIQLLETFADQAVIAIENVRLFNETKEALEQLKASAEILRVISSSVEDTKPVFDTILESCQRLFEGPHRRHYYGRATTALSISRRTRGRGRCEFEAHFPIPLSARSGSGVAILERGSCTTRTPRRPRVPDYARRGRRITGSKSVIFAPMLWEGQGIGAIFVGRAIRRTVLRKGDRPAQDLRRPGGHRHPERAPVPRDQGKEHAARGRQPAQVRVPGQHVARAAHAAQRDHRLHAHRDAPLARSSSSPSSTRTWRRSCSSGQHLLRSSMRSWISPRWRRAGSRSTRPRWRSRRCSSSA